MANFKPITLYKGGNCYLCETAERLERFTAAGWKKTKPNNRTTPDSRAEADLPDAAADSKE